MSDLVGNPEDLFSQVAAHFTLLYVLNLKVLISFVCLEILEVSEILQQCQCPIFVPRGNIYCLLQSERLKATNIISNFRKHLL